MIVLLIARACCCSPYSARRFRPDCRDRAVSAFMLAGAPGTAVAIEFYRLADMPALIAIPLFTLAGYLLAESQAPRRLVRLTNAMFGWLPGGLAIVSVCACTLVHGVHRRDRRHARGARRRAVSGACARLNYDERFSLGLLTCSGSLGLLLVPSMPLILYGVVAQQFHTTPPVSVDALFKAGLLPCLLMVAMLSVYSAWIAHATCRGRHAQARARSGRRSRTPAGNCRCRSSFSPASIRDAWPRRKRPRRRRCTF